MKEDFNYCIAHYWEDDGGEIDAYAYHSEVQYGTRENAQEFLEYVKQQYPEHDWKIFKIVELNDEYTN